MKAVFGVVSLLVVLAVVGMLASRQMKSATTITPAASAAAPGANVRQQSQQIQDQVRQDIGKALDQAATRRSDADQ